MDTQINQLQCLMGRVYESARTAECWQKRERHDEGERDPDMHIISASLP